MMERFSWKFLIHVYYLTIDFEVEVVVVDSLVLDRWGHVVEEWALEKKVKRTKSYVNLLRKFNYDQMIGMLLMNDDLMILYLMFLMVLHLHSNVNNMNVHQWQNRIEIV